MKVARTVWILTKFKRIVRDGTEDAKTEAINALVKDAKEAALKLKSIKGVDDIDFAEDNKSATVKYDSKEIGFGSIKELQSTGLIASIVSIGTNHELTSVKVKMDDQDLFTINEFKNHENIKSSILNQLEDKKYKKLGKFTIIAKGKNIENFEYAVTFEESKSN